MSLNTVWQKGGSGGWKTGKDIKNDDLSAIFHETAAAGENVSFLFFSFLFFFFALFSLSISLSLSL